MTGLSIASLIFAFSIILTGGPTTTVPAPGEVWIDARLLGILGISVGDALELGVRRFRVAKVLSYEPDRGGDLFSIAPRLLMNLADVPSTELVQRGSRVRHRLVFAGPQPAIDDFRAWLLPRLSAQERIQGVRDARPELRTALERANQFLGLAALVSVLLAGIAIAVAARRHAERHLDGADDELAACQAERLGATIERRDEVVGQADAGRAPGHATSVVRT